MKNEELIGKKFTRLTVLEKTSLKDKWGSIYWRCKCDCGNETLLFIKDVKSGKRVSCGCLRQERALQSKKLKLQGKRFGRLLVIGETDQRTKDGKIKWRCLCDCGNEAVVNGSALVDGTTTSCGCYRTEILLPRLEAARNFARVENTNLDMLTSKPTKKSTTGVRGVYYNKKRKVYQAYIKFKGKRTYLGCFQTLDEAAEARKNAEDEYFKPILEKYKDKLTSKEKQPIHKEKGINHVHG